MAKAQPSIPFDHLSGKISSRERIVTRTRNGRTQVYAVNRPYTGPLSEARRRVVGAFSQAVSQCKAEMSDPERLAWWQERYARYCKAARRHAPRANAAFLGTASDRFYSTLRGFVIASLIAQA